MENTLSCTVMDYCKQTSTVSMGANFGVTDAIAQAFTVNKAEALKTLIEKYSYGKVIRSSLARSTNHAMPDKAWYQTIADLVNSKIGLNMVDQKAVLIMRHATTGKAIRFSIPAPHQDLFYYVEQQGLRVTSGKGEEIAKGLTTALGVGTIEFVRGYHTGKA